MSQFLTMDSLIGLKINSAKINEDNDVVFLSTDKGEYFLSWHGDCCAHCFIAGITGADNFKDAIILSVENSEWKSEKDDDCEVVESMGSKIKTSKGYITIETRLEHNGYYSGGIDVTKDNFDYSKFKELKDI